MIIKTIEPDTIDLSVAHCKCKLPPRTGRKSGRGRVRMDEVARHLIITLLPTSTQPPSHPSRRLVSDLLGNSISPDTVTLDGEKSREANGHDERASKHAQ